MFGHWSKHLEGQFGAALGENTHHNESGLARAGNGKMINRTRNVLQTQRRKLNCISLNIIKDIPSATIVLTKLILINFISANLAKYLVLLGLGGGNKWDCG